MAQQNWRHAIHSIVRARKVTSWRLLPLHAMAKYLKGRTGNNNTGNVKNIIGVFTAESSRWRWRTWTSTSPCGVRRSTAPSWRRASWRRRSSVWRPLTTTVPRSTETSVNIPSPDQIRPSLLTSRESSATLVLCGRGKINIDHLISLHFTSLPNEILNWL